MLESCPHATRKSSPASWPFTFNLRLGDDGSATVEGGMEVRTYTGCVYEGEGLDGGFELSERGVPLDVRLSGTLTLVAEEEPGAECSATNTVSLFVGCPYGIPGSETTRPHTPPPPPAHWTSDGTPIKVGQVVPVALSKRGRGKVGHASAVGFNDRVQRADRGEDERSPKPGGR